MSNISKIKIENNTYDIKDEIARNSIIYSQTETVIGEINGETLYRKIVDYTPTQTIGASGQLTDINIPHHITNFKNIVKATGVKLKTGHVLPVLGGTSGVTSASLIRVVDNTNINFRIINDIWGPTTWRFILEYTKNS